MHWFTSVCRQSFSLGWSVDQAYFRLCFHWGIFMPPDWMIGGILFLSCLFVCLSVVNFNLRYNFGTIRDKDFIFGKHTPLMMPFQLTPRSLVSFDLDAKNNFFRLCCRQGHSVSQTHLDFFSQTHLVSGRFMKVQCTSFALMSNKFNCLICKTSQHSWITLTTSSIRVHLSGNYTSGKKKQCIFKIAV